MTIRELLSAAVQADAEERAKARAAKDAADAAVRARTAPAIADVRWAMPELAALTEHRDGVQQLYDRWHAHRVIGQSHWIANARCFLDLTDPAARDFMGLGALRRLLAALEACTGTTPAQTLDWLLYCAQAAREWPAAAAAALNAFVAEAATIEDAEQRRRAREEVDACLARGETPSLELERRLYEGRV